MLLPHSDLLLKTNLEVVHSVWQCHNKAWVIVNGLVTEDDIYTVVQVSEVVFCSRELTGFIFRIIPGGDTTKEQSILRPC